MAGLATVPSNSSSVTLKVNVPALSSVWVIVWTGVVRLLYANPSTFAISLTLPPIKLELFSIGTVTDKPELYEFQYPEVIGFQCETTTGSAFVVFVMISPTVKSAGGRSLSKMVTSKSLSDTTSILLSSPVAQLPSGPLSR